MSVSKSGRACFILPKVLEFHRKCPLSPRHLHPARSFASKRSSKSGRFGLWSVPIRRFCGSLMCLLRIRIMSSLSYGQCTQPTTNAHQRRFSDIGIPLPRVFSPFDFYYDTLCCPAMYSSVNTQIKPCGVRGFIS